MITQDQAEKAVDWLRENARSMAQARAERLYMEQWVKTVKAQEMATNEYKSTGVGEILASQPVAAQERAALCSPKYLAALQAYKEAIEADEYNRFMVTAAEAKIEAWRSQESTRRAEAKL